MTVTIVIAIGSILALILVCLFKFANKLDGGVVTEQLALSGKIVTKIRFDFIRAAFEVEYTDQDRDEHHAYIVALPFAVMRDDIVKYSPTSPKRSTKELATENQKLRDEIKHLKDERQTPSN